jgi:uncharacterized damage-inducible protein DinB
MTYYGGKELAAAFRTVRGNTIRIAEEIPEDKYDFRPAAACRSIAQTLTHIALGPRIQRHIQANKVTDLTTVNFPELFMQNMAEEAQPRTKAEIIAFLKAEGESFASFLESLPESFLSEQVKVHPGGPVASKSRFEMLLSPKEHEMHHRAQLMTAQRMNGQVPHLTRELQERMAARAETAAQAAR